MPQGSNRRAHWNWPSQATNWSSGKTPLDLAPSTGRPTLRSERAAKTWLRSRRSHSRWKRSTDTVDFPSTAPDSTKSKGSQPIRSSSAPKQVSARRQSKSRPSRIWVRAER